MQADFSIELGKDDHCLEIPWQSADATQRYLNLKLQPELLLNVAEVHDNLELAEFLNAINGKRSLMETAKCDSWCSNEIHPEEEIFGAAWKFGSYVDVVFSSLTTRCTFEDHEEFVRSLTGLLAKAPDFAAAVEFVVRRCYFHAGKDLASSDNGFCITVYVTGFGDSDEEARKRWVIGLKVVQNALLQVMARHQKRHSETT